MPSDLTVERFLKLASPLEGERLVTAARGAAFQVSARPTGLEVTPESTGRSRTVPVSRISQFLEEYSTSGVERPGHYQDITFDASYLLAILSHVDTEVS